MVSLFPNTKGNSSPRTNSPDKKQVYGDYGKVTTQNNAWGNSGSAARYFYCAKASKGERNKGCEYFKEQALVGQGLAGENNNPKHQNNHPTVKPLELMRYLVRLVTPKGGIVLDPFMGSGTTGIACKELGFEFIGIEMNEEYCEIAKARINA